MSSIKRFEWQLSKGGRQSEQYVGQHFRQHFSQHVGTICYTFANISANISAYSFILFFKMLRKM